VGIERSKIAKTKMAHVRRRNGVDGEVAWRGGLNEAAAVFSSISIE